MAADRFDELEKLHSLKEKGALTEQEFEQEKAALLSSTSSLAQSSGSQPPDRRAWIRDGGRAFHHYSPWVMAGLSFFTFGIYTVFWLNHWHGVMPKRRDDDPSTAKANWLLFIPLYGIYWMFVSLLRVCTRLDEELADAQVQQRVPKELVRWFCIFDVIPYVNYLVPPFLGFITVFQMQSRVNRLALLDEEYYASRFDAPTVTG